MEADRSAATWRNARGLRTGVRDRRERAVDVLVRIERATRLRRAREASGSLRRASRTSRPDRALRRARRDRSRRGGPAICSGKVPEPLDARRARAALHACGERLDERPGSRSRRRCAPRCSRARATTCRTAEVQRARLAAPQRAHGGGDARRFGRRRPLAAPVSERQSGCRRALQIRRNDQRRHLARRRRRSRQRARDVRADRIRVACSSAPSRHRCSERLDVARQRRVDTRGATSRDRRPRSRRGCAHAARCGDWRGRWRSPVPGGAASSRDVRPCGRTRRPRPYRRLRTGRAPDECRGRSPAPRRAASPSCPGSRSTRRCPRRARCVSKRFGAVHRSALVRRRSRGARAPAP